MEKQNLLSALNNSFLAIIFLYASAFGTAQEVFAQFPREISVKVGEIKTFKVQQQIVEEDVKAEVGNATVCRARFDKDKKEFRIQGLKEGTTRVVFSGNYRGGNSMMGALQTTPFNETVNVSVLPPVEIANPNASGLQSEQGKNVRIFYTTLRLNDALKAEQILRDKGYVPNKRLVEEGASTQSQNKKLYCVLSSGGTEAGVRMIAELVKNVESVRTECLDDRPNTEPQYALWIVSEKPFIAELEDYKKEVEEAGNVFIRRFGSPPQNNYIQRTYIEEFEKEGTGDFERASNRSSDVFWLEYAQPNSRTAAAAIYVRPLAILQTSVFNIKENNYSPTPEEISYFRSQMTDWRTRKDQLTPLLNEIIVFGAQDNSDNYAYKILKTLSYESLKARQSERRESRKNIGAQINELKSRPVFAYTLGGVRNR